MFITDDLLAVIMVASRSIYSWDIRILKENGMVVFDRADMSRLGVLSDKICITIKKYAVRSYDMIRL